MGLLGKPHHFRKPRASPSSPGLVAKYGTWRSNGGGARRSAGVGQRPVAAGPGRFLGAKGVADLGDEDPIFCGWWIWKDHIYIYIHIYVCLYVRHMMMFTTGTYFWMPFVWIYGIIWLVPSCLLLDLHMAMTDCDSWTWECMSPLIRLI